MGSPPYPDNRRNDQTAYYPNAADTAPINPQSYPQSYNYPNQTNAQASPYPDEFGAPPPYDEAGIQYDENKIYLSPDVGTNVRHRFIRKVFGILTVQLFFTTAIISLFNFVNPIRVFLLKNAWVFYLSVSFSFIMLMVMVCIPKLLRKHPTNIILMVIFTLLESITLGCISSLYAREFILMAMGTVTLIVVALILFATQVKYDFTKWYPYLMVASLCLLVFMMFALLFQDKVVNYVYATLGMILVSMYIVFDTQMICGGKKYELHEDEYMFGVLMLYVDIIMLYQYVLLLFGGSN